VQINVVRFAENNTNRRSLFKFFNHKISAQSLNKYLKIYNIVLYYTTYLMSQTQTQTQTQTKHEYDRPTDIVASDPLDGEPLSIFNSFSSITETLQCCSTTLPNPQPNTCDFRTNEGYIKETGQRIYPQDYTDNLKGKIVCKNGHSLIFVKNKWGTQFFKHKNEKDIAPNFTPMTEWHNEWQNSFPEECRECKITGPDTVKSFRRADVLIEVGINKKTLEFQHSHINKKDVEDRVSDHQKCGCDLIWLVNGDLTVNVEDYDDCSLLRFKADYWKYTSFQGNDSYFIEIDDKIYRINANLVAFNYIKVPKPISRDEFLKLMFDKRTHRRDEDIVHIPQTDIFFNKKGAGSGKTYDICRIFSEERWKDKHTFVFTTKQNSNVSGINNQIKEHINKGILVGLESLGEPEQLSGNKYLFKFKRLTDDSEIWVFLGTLDSFVNSISSPDTNGPDIFAQRVKHMQYAKKLDGNGRTKFGGVKISVNAKMLFCVDEGQDNDSDYYEGIVSLACKTHNAAYICGDPLQCLKYSENLITLSEGPHPEQGGLLQFHEDGNTNETRRFGPEIAEFVNQNVPYQHFGRDPLTCSFTNEERHDSIYEDRAKPHNILKGVKVISKPKFGAVTEEWDTFRKDFVDFMRCLSKKNYLVPEDWLISFAILADQVLPKALESEINEMWGELFLKPEYQDTVLKKHPYWKNHYETHLTMSFDFCQLHSSAGDGSININESERKTRIVSIHTAKGDGRPVSVSFLSQGALEARFDPFGPGNRIYESFLNVSLTRAKLLQVCVTSPDDGDIYNRIMTASEILEISTWDFKPNFPNNFCTLHEINKFDKSDLSSELFQRFTKEFQKELNEIDLEYNFKEFDSNQDIEHHQIRGSMVFTAILLGFIEAYKVIPQETLTQIQYIFRECSKMPYIKHLLPQHYNSFEKYKTHFPLFLSHETLPISKILHDIRYEIHNTLANKMMASEKRGISLELCPLESLMLEYSLGLRCVGPKKSFSPLLIDRVIKGHLENFPNLKKESHTNCNCEKLSDSFCQTSVSISNIQAFYDYVLVSPKKIKEEVERNVQENPDSKCKLFHKGSLEIKKTTEEIKNSLPFLQHSCRDKKVRAYIHKPHITETDKESEVLICALHAFFIFNPNKESENSETIIEGQSNDFTNFQGVETVEIVLCALNLNKPLILTFTRTELQEKKPLFTSILKEVIETRKRINVNELLSKWIYHSINEQKNTKTSLEEHFDYMVKFKNIRHIPQYITNVIWRIDEDLEDGKSFTQQEILDLLNKQLKRYMNSLF